MCGRYTLSVSVDELWEEFDLEGDPPELLPRYNIAPTQQVPVVIDREPKKLDTLRWGLVPHWAKDPSIGNRMINARGETAADKPAFRDAFKKRRCLVLADGFYEWKKEGKVKRPMLIRLASGAPFAFAGLWSAWRPTEGELLRTCTIVTTDAEGPVAAVHDRMPVILSVEARRAWLDREASRDELQALIRPFDDPFRIHEVSRLVSSPRNDDPMCIEPVPSEPVERQRTLFDDL